MASAFSGRAIHIGNPNSLQLLTCLHISDKVCGSGNKAGKASYRDDRGIGMKCAGF